MIFFRKIILGFLLINILLVNQNKAKALPPAPKTIAQFKEIGIQYDGTLPELYNALKPEERVFLYFMYRASLPGNRIFADQIHRDANTIIDLFYTIISNKDGLVNAQPSFFDINTFLEQAECFFTYVWTNHGQYFEKEFENNKRTPERLGLSLLTPQNLVTILKILDYPKPEETIRSIQKSLFDQDYESRLVVPDSIEKSAINIYAKGFTEDDYQRLPAGERSKINNYFYVDFENENRISMAQAYKIGGHYSNELTAVCYWINKAIDHAKKYPMVFDEHLIKSLEYLELFFQTGDEELFKLHSIEWLKTTSNISYSLGFIETYKDPKDVRGFFEGDVTIRSVDLKKLNSVLPSIEQQLPFPQEFKRSDMSKLPNAMIGCKVFGIGDLGPLRITSAYCLPNYGEIRSIEGSKQIIYTVCKGLSATINPEGYRKLFFPQDREEWLAQNDPDHSLLDAFWTKHVILHETIGHGSGRYAMHRFVDGEKLTIEGKTYSVGDHLQVTSSNITEFLAGYGSTLEELRAEIIAFYVMITNMNILTDLGFFKQWEDKLSKQELIDWAIFCMISSNCLGRLMGQTDQATDISGDHARADWVIYSYLLDAGCFSVTEQTKELNDTKRTMLAINDIDIEKTIKTAEKLMQEIQRIKSTGDGLAAKKLIDSYCKPIRTPQYIAIMKNNLKTLIGDLKVSALLNPILKPIYDEQTNNMIDIEATWPKDIFELADYQQKCELSTQAIA